MIFLPTAGEEVPIFECVFGSCGFGETGGSFGAYTRFGHEYGTFPSFNLDCVHCGLMALLWWDYSEGGQNFVTQEWAEEPETPLGISSVEILRAREARERERGRIYPSS